MRGLRAAGAVPVFALALILIVAGLGIAIAAWLLLKLVGVAMIVGGFWLLRVTEDLTGAPRRD